jgi:hypothetical protein
MRNFALWCCGVRVMRLWQGLVAFRLWDFNDVALWRGRKINLSTIYLFFFSESDVPPLGSIPSTTPTVPSMIITVPSIILTISEERGCKRVLPCTVAKKLREDIKYVKNKILMHLENFVRAF